MGLDDGKAVRALDSVRERLLGDYGVELLAPCYTVYHKELGEITSYPPGYKENGSVFCHNNPWISIAETADYGILRLIVDDASRASSILLEQGFILTMTPVVGVAVSDTPGGLSKVLSIISRAEIDVEYMYSVFGQKDGQACMIFRVADVDRLTALLDENGIGTITGETLGIH